MKSRQFKKLTQGKATVMKYVATETFKFWTRLRALNVYFTSEKEKEKKEKKEKVHLARITSFPSSKVPTVISI